MKMNRLGVPVFPPSSDHSPTRAHTASGLGNHTPTRGHTPSGHSAYNLTHGPPPDDDQPLPPYSTNDFGNYRTSYDRSAYYKQQSEISYQKLSPTNQHSPTKFGNNWTNHQSSQSVVGNHSNQQSPTKLVNQSNNQGSKPHHMATSNVQSPKEFNNYRFHHHSPVSSPSEISDHRIGHHPPSSNLQSTSGLGGDHRINYEFTNNQQLPNKFGKQGDSIHQVTTAMGNLNHGINHASSSNIQSPTEVPNRRLNYGATNKLQSPTKSGNHGSMSNIPSQTQSANRMINYSTNLQSPNEVSNHRISQASSTNHQLPNKFTTQQPNHGSVTNLQSPNEVGNHKVSHMVASKVPLPSNTTANVTGINPQVYYPQHQTVPKDIHPFRLHRSLPLNDTESTHLFTFLVTLDNLDDLREVPVRSSVASYQGHKWYLTSGIYKNNDGIEFLGVFLYWLTTQNHTVGGNDVDIKCRTDYRIIVRNVINPSESKISEGAQMEYSPSMTTGWGKRELITIQELCSRGNGFINEPGNLVIVELAMKSCTTTFEHYIDVSHLGTQTFQDQNQFPAHFTPNFSLGAYEFYLSVYPRGDREKARSCVSMYLHRYSSSSDLLGCRVRFHFFVGKRVSPSNGATFDYVFKENKGYGKYKAFEPLVNTDFMNRSSILTIGVVIVSVTPLAQVEIPLVTRGYYHTDNFVFDEVVFPDHHFNYWKLSVDNSNPMLQLKFDAEDKEMLQTTDSNKTSCTKFLQWRAFVISRKDKKKSKAVLACPLTSFFSRHLSDSEIMMSTQIPLQTAKELNGDYCTKQEPSLLIRLEILDLQDLPEAVHEQPVLHFERIQLYHMRDGFRRCMKVQNRLEMQVEELKKRMNEVLHDRRVSKEDALQQLQAILQSHETASKASSPAALPHSLDVPSEASEPLSDSVDGTSWLPPPFVNHHVPETIEADPQAGIMQTDL